MPLYRGAGRSLQELAFASRALTSLGSGLHVAEQPNIAQCQNELQGRPAKRKTRATVCFSTTARKDMDSDLVDGVVSTKT